MTLWTVTVWILVVFSPGPGVATSIAAFKSEASCQAAAKQLARDARATVCMRRDPE